MNMNRPAKAEAAVLLSRIRGLVPQAMLSDQAAAGRRIRQLQQRAERSGDPKTVVAELGALAARLAESGRERALRAERQPAVAFP
ncbi:MAG: hypothetical protein MUP19_10575, partial [Candidatus Aminicenantes bacterium]|nr:hypothetical protein [Candidatus Aminicenantes bacterium]